MRFKNILTHSLPVAFLILIPSITYASNLQSLVSNVARLLNRVIPIIMAIALIVFMWGIIKLIGADSDDGRTEGKQRMLWGVIALFVLVSIWGITRYIGSTLGIGRDSQMVAPDYPRFRGGGGSPQYNVELEEFEPL